MKSVRCPYCQTELIGNFKPGEPITCAACKGQFQPPPDLLKDDSVSHEVCPFCGTSFESKDPSETFIQCPACKGRFTKRPAFQKASVSRPEDIRLATLLLVASVVIGSILYFIAFIWARQNGDRQLMDDVVKGSIGSFPFKLLSILFCWKVFKGRDWPRCLFNVLIPLGILFSVLTTLARHAAEAIVQSPSNSELEWTRWVALFLLTALGIGSLYYLNSSESRAWLRLPKNQKHIADRPWWIAVLLVVGLCPFLLVLMALSQPLPKDPTSEFDSSAKHQDVVHFLTEPRVPAKSQESQDPQTSVTRHSVPSRPAPPNTQVNQPANADSTRTASPRVGAPVERTQQPTARTLGEAETKDGLRTEMVDGIPWTFTVNDGLATISAKPTHSFPQPVLPSIPYDTPGSITIPASLAGFPVVKIGDCAFSYCTKLDRVTIPGSVKTIGRRAFYNCTANSIVLENGVSCIEPFAFDDCSMLSITLPNSITSIPKGAFHWCGRLKTVYIPSSVKEITANPFGGCSDLSTISVSSDNSTFFSREGVLYNRITRTLIAYPPAKKGRQYSILKGTLRIEKNAFDHCDQLTAISVPDGVAEIGALSFSGTPITDITLPASVTAMGGTPFMSCSRLKTVRFLGNRPKYLGGGVTWHSLDEDAEPRDAIEFFDKPVTVYVSHHSTGWDHGLSTEDIRHASFRYFD